MSAKSSKGIKICMSGPVDDSTSYISVTPTAITKAKPAVVTVASAAGIAKGDVITFDNNTGFPELDSKTFIVGTVDSGANTFEVMGSDTTASTGTLVGATSVKVFEEAKFTCLCLSSLSIAADAPGTIAVGTYCDPTASIPASVSSAGTLSFSGYVDTTAKDYPALLAAEIDAKTRLIRILLPGNGYIVAPLIVGSITWSLPLDGAVSFDGTAVLGSKPVHRFP